MYNVDTDLIFPTRVIPFLRDLRGDEWTNMIDQVLNEPSDSQQCLGFMLMMVRLTGCMTCSADSYRAMRGCTECASQALRRFRDSDEELIKKYNEALSHIAETDLIHHL